MKETFWSKWKRGVSIVAIVLLSATSIAVPAAFYAAILIVPISIFGNGVNWALAFWIFIPIYAIMFPAVLGQNFEQQYAEFSSRK